MRDLAYDVVGELFAGEEEQCCASLRSGLADAAPEDREAILSSFEAILFKNVHQHLARIFGELNPLHQHLLRSLRGHVARNENLTSLDRLDGRWYLHSNSSMDTLVLPAMPIEDLRRHLHIRGIERAAPVARILHAVLQSLQEQDEYRKAVLEADVVQLTRESLGMEYPHQTVKSNDPVESSDADVLGRILMRTLDATLPWIDEIYVQKKRLSTTEAECLVSAIRMYFKDLMGENEALGPYSYLRQCMPGLTHARFRSSYRRKFEYILQRVLDEAYIQLGRDATLLR
ncbi:hypothetical protein KQI65_15420 [bacterium]|nr:hypothetical protein [bacterium]